MTENKRSITALRTAPERGTVARLMWRLDQSATSDEYMTVTRAEVESVRRLVTAYKTLATKHGEDIDRMYDDLKAKGEL